MLLCLYVFTSRPLFRWLRYGQSGCHVSWERGAGELRAKICATLKIISSLIQAFLPTTNDFNFRRFLQPRKFYCCDFCIYFWGFQFLVSFTTCFDSLPFPCPLVRTDRSMNQRSMVTQIHQMAHLSKTGVTFIHSTQIMGNDG